MTGTPSISSQRSSSGLVAVKARKSSMVISSSGTVFGRMVWALGFLGGG